MIVCTVCLNEAVSSPRRDIEEDVKLNERGEPIPVEEHRKPFGS